MSLRRKCQFTSLVMCALSGVFFCGCSHYQLKRESTLPISKIAVGKIENLSNEPKLSAYLRNKLPEFLMQDGTLKVVSSQIADAVIDTRILAYDVNGVGEVRIQSREEDQRNYRTAIYEIYVDLEYSVTVLGNAELVIPPGKIRGTAEYTELVDNDIVRQDGLKKATANACAKLVSAITDSW